MGCISNCRKEKLYFSPCNFVPSLCNSVKLLHGETQRRHRGSQRFFNTCDKLKRTRENKVSNTYGLQPVPYIITKNPQKI